MGFAITQDAPAAEPVELDAAKLHLEYTPTDKDAVIVDAIVAAREQAEDYTQLAFVSRSVVAQWDRFPPWDEGDGYHQYRHWMESALYPSPHRRAIRLPLWPVSAVASVTYYDAAGVQQTLAAGTDYLTHLPHMPALVYPAPGRFWPIPQYGRLGGVAVTFTAGYGAAAAVPRQAGRAILITLDYWFKNRGGDDDPTSPLPSHMGLPVGAIRLLNQLSRARV